MIENKKDDILEKLVHINRITKVVKGGRRFGFSALVVVGNQNGKLLAQMWLGITTDEEQRRNNASDVIWAQPTYPLLDIHRISRKECVKILKDTEKLFKLP